MAELIVDFPSRNGRSCPSKKEMLPASPTLTQRSVRFSENSALYITERATEEELRLRWYSKEERSELRAAFGADVVAMRWRLATAPAPSAIGRDDLLNCVGMEQFLSQDVYKHTVARRCNHVRAILAVQERLRMLKVRGAQDEEQLPRISELSSEWTVKRSRDIATKYWDTLRI